MFNQSRRVKVTWILGIVLLLLIGVYVVRPAYLYLDSRNVHLAQHRCLKEGKPDDPRRFPRPNPGIVKTIHLTDLGETEDRCQYTDALYELNWDRKLLGASDFNVAVKPDTRPQPRFVVLYIHGWRHNANTSDYQQFKRVVEKLQQSNKTKQVTGIYVTWNASSNVPLWEYLTFWNRMRAADRIAQSAIVAKLMGAISSILDQSEFRVDNQFIAIGHSFGARILYTATSQTLLHQTQNSHPGGAGGSYKVIRGLADTTILLNPAFEASLFTSLNSVLRFEEKFSPSQPPLLVAVSTDADMATKWAFPIGQWLGWWAAESEITTLGNYERFTTHTLRPKKPDECPQQTESSERMKAFRAGLCLERAPMPTRSLLEWEQEELLRARKSNNPFLVVTTNSSVIEDHSKIWNSPIENWLIDFLEDAGRMHSATRSIGITDSPKR